MTAEPPLTIRYPDDLPVSGRRDDILAALRAHQVIVVAGATGSGKTTQLPKMLLELGKRRIAHTQPRRIAARAVAERVAAELGTELGGAVGYRVRFTDQASRSSRLVVMTDGILLNEIHRDPDLRRYDAIVIDEAHERSLTVDFLLGYLRRLLPRRPDLTVVVTSATIDPVSFARHFGTNAGPAPVVEVSGRTYPVEIRYRPLIPDGAGVADGEARDTVSAVLDALAELGAEPPGDVLVFLSGESEIRDVLDAVTGAELPGTEVLPLYGRLSAAEQHRVFESARAPGIRRRIILATNVAETSLTVPGIRYVVDAGTARISRWSARSKVQRLPIEPISQASAAQRAGRAGREAPGIAIRLYAEADFASRPEFTDPEIRRTDLAAVLLQMAVLGLGDIADFPFLDPPDRRGVRDGLALLTELGALDADGEVTRVGRDLARLPLDPRLGRMLLAARELDVVDDVLPIVAGLSIQDPRERPEATREQAEQAHRRHADPTSDFITLLRLWRHLEAQQAARSGSGFRRMLRAEYLSYLRVREWQDVVRQLRIALELPRRRARPLAAASSWPEDAAATSRRGPDQTADRSVDQSPPSEPSGVAADRIHQAILAGLLSRIGLRDERDDARGGPRGGTKPGTRRRRAEYLGSRGTRFAIHPGSVLAKRAPDAVMSAELVETGRLYARMNAAIDPAWAERWAGDLVVRSVSEPRWDRRRGEAVADEKVMLYGVPIVPRRRIRFARVDPGYARELFIRHALVAGEWDVSRVARRLTEFHRRNAELREHLEDLQDRERRRDLLLGEEALVAWYRTRIPEQVDSTREFERWWRREREARPELLTMRESDFLDPEAAEPEARQAGYPERWQHGGLDLALEYRHAPGADDDGVTLIVPASDPVAALETLDAVDADALEWLVPGMREELVAGWIKTLPKVLRREVVPAGDWARRIAPELPDVPVGRFGDVLAATIKRLTFAPVTRHEFELARLPAHLRMHVRLVDADGRTMAADRDLDALRTWLAARGAAGRARGGGSLAGEQPGGADSPGTSRAAAGDVSEPVRGQTADTPSAEVQALIKYAVDHLTDTERLRLATSPYRSVPALLADCVTAAGGDGAAPDEVFRIVGLVAEILGAAREVDRAIRATTSLALVGPLRDARAQLDALVHPRFVAQTGSAQLRRYPVYLAGLAHRLGRLAEQIGRDRVWQGEVATATDLYREAGGTLPIVPGLRPELVRVRWLLEELRLSLFAQHLPTAEPVSLQRIRRALAEL